MHNYNYPGDFCNLSFILTLTTFFFFFWKIQLLILFYRMLFNPKMFLSFASYLYFSNIDSFLFFIIIIIIQKKKKKSKRIWLVVTLWFTYSLFSFIWKWYIVRFCVPFFFFFELFWIRRFWGHSRRRKKEYAFKKLMIGLKEGTRPKH